MPVVGLFGVGLWWLTSYKENIVENQNSVLSLLSDAQLFQFSDPASVYTFQEIQNLPPRQWQKTEAANFGYKGGTGWVRSHFFSPSSQPVLLELKSHFIDSVSLWLVDEKGIIKEYSLMDYRKLFQNSHNPLMHRYPTFRLELEEGRRYGIFIRSSTAPGLTLKYNLRYWDQSGFIRYLRASDWGWALFVGAILIAVGVALLSLIFQGQRIYLYYVGYVLCLSFYALLIDGWGIFLPEFLARLSSPVSIAHFLNLGACFLLLFSREFLIIPKQDHRWWLRISPWLGYALATLFITMIHYGYSLEHEVLLRSGYWLAIGIALLMGLLWLGYWWNAVRRGFRPAWLLLAAQLVMFLFYGTNLFFVNISARTLACPDMQIFRLAILVDLVIIAAGWVYRQQIIRQSQLNLQEANLAQQQRILEAEQRWQEEEIRVLRLENDLYEQRERIGRDLHDSIGSQLSHIISRLDLLSLSPYLEGSQLASLS